MTISTRKRFRFLAAACALCVAGLLMQGVVYGTDTVSIPSDWWTTVANGPYKQVFTALPDWGNAGGLASVDTSGGDSHGTVNTAYDSRPNQWFGAKGDNGGNSLKLTTGSSEFTTPAITGSSGFSDKPVFIDMRVKFVALSSAPSLGTAKLGVYVLSSDKTKLQVVDGGGAFACATVASDLTTAWHHLTVRMNSAKTYQVFLDDTSIVSGRSLNNANDQKLNSVAFTGTGWIDELYLSNGDPKGPFPSTLSTALAGADTTTKNWVAGKMNAGGVNAVDVFNSYDTGAKLNNAYLLDTLSSTYNTPVFGIKSFDLITSTTLHVTYKLTSTDGALKSGAINGKIRLSGKATAGAGWTQIGSDLSAPTFTGGELTPTDFTVSDTYRYFNPQIVP